MSQQRIIRIGDLLGSKILTDDGRHIGHVVDIELTRDTQPQAKALIYGRHGWLYRWHVLEPFASKFGQHFAPDSIPWQAVEQFENLTIILKRGYEPETRRQQGR